MKKVIPLSSVKQEKVGPPAPGRQSASAAVASPAALQQGTEPQLLLLMNKMVGCSDQSELIRRYFTWAADNGLADGLTFTLANGKQLLKLGQRRHHSVQYELKIDEQVLGAVVVCRRQRYPEAELMVIEQTLGVFARCLQVAQEMEVLKSRATLDPLTGLGNRNALGQWLKTEISRSRRHGGPLTLLMIDVDHFKTINDRMGHLVGDQVLKLIARVFETSTRGSDLRFRFGGDEFAILLPHTDLKGAENAAAQIRANLARVAGAEFGLEDTDDKLRPDISIGIAAYERGDDEESLLRRADTHLYHAKAMGRGRVCSRP